MTQLDNMEEDMMEAGATEVQVENNLSKAQKKRFKKNKVRDVKRLTRQQQTKREDPEPPISSNIVLPEKKKKGFISLLDTDEKLLAEIRSRFNECSEYALQCRPIPQPCPPGLLKDLCPLAVSVRLPTKRGAGYAFLIFRNEHELKLAEEQLASKCINGKPVKVSRCSQPPRKTSDQWCPPGERPLVDFNLKKLLVSRLNRSTTRFDLAQVFRYAVNVKLPTFDDGSCKGTCILTYRSLSTALLAFETRNGTFVRGSPIYVNFLLKPKAKPESAPVAPAVPTIAKKALRASVKRPPSDESDQEMDEHLRKEKSIRLDPVIQTSPSPISTKSTVSPSEEIHQINNKKQLITRTGKRPTTPHPKLLAPHQLKGAHSVQKTVVDSRLSALEALLGTESIRDNQKPKHAKKVKRRAAKTKGIKMIGKRGR